MQRFKAACRVNQLPITLTFDMGNWLWVGDSPEEAARHLAPAVSYIHVKAAEPHHSHFRAVPPDEASGRWLALLDNLPADACVEVPCLVDKMGVNPCHVGRLPVQLAAMNMTNINAQLMTIEAARTRKREDIYRAAMLDPHTAAELSIDDIVKMCDDLIEAHGDYMAMYK